MSIHVYAFLGAIVLSVAGQLLLKVGARSREKIAQSFFNRFTLAGYGLLGITSALTVVAFRGMELKFYTACSSVTYPLILLGSWLLLKEKIDKQLFLGTTLVFLGVTIYMLG
jgi:small multidrug resistance pump